MVTIHDVAKAAGVSETTVSLVLRGKQCRVSEQTRQRVLDAADQLHYVPNQVAVVARHAKNLYHRPDLFRHAQSVLRRTGARH